uniref:Uncharacterized protein n=1 Tax=Ehrlichia ruminantium TaxID=779 RepID=Q93FQ5_EHRRU|nr:unknown [Ehrlichia ruminantium]
MSGSFSLFSSCLLLTNDSFCLASNLSIFACAFLSRSRRVLRSGNAYLHSTCISTHIVMIHAINIANQVIAKSLYGITHH